MTVTLLVLDTADTGETGFHSEINVVAQSGESVPVAADNAESVKLNIVTPVTGIALSKSEMNMVIGQTDTLTATLAPEGVSS